MDNASQKTPRMSLKVKQDWTSNDFADSTVYWCNSAKNKVGKCSRFLIRLRSKVTIWYMSKITRTQNLGVSRWRATSCATVVASFGLCHRDTPVFALLIYWCRCTILSSSNPITLLTIILLLEHKIFTFDPFVHFKDLFMTIYWLHILRFLCQSIWGL